MSGEPRSGARLFRRALAASELAEDRAEGGEHVRSDALQLRLVTFGKLAQEFGAGGGEAQEHRAPIDRSTFAHDESPGFELIDERDGRVMFDTEPLGDRTDGRLLFERQALDGEQELMLLRLDAQAARRLFAEGEEAAELVAKSRERSVVGGGDLGHGPKT